MTKDLEVRHCRALVAVYDSGGIGAAARRLGVAQSTISETLLSLERLFGSPVTLRRKGREATLTALAEDLVPYARSLIALSEEALAVGAQQNREAIRLGTVESISSFLLPEPLNAFRLSWPHIDVRISTGLCEDLRRQVETGDLDAAITIEEAGDGEFPNLVPVELLLVVQPRHPFADRPVSARDIREKALLLSDAEGAFNRLLGIWMGGNAQSPKFESAGSIEGVKRGVLRSDAVGVLPDYAVTEELSAGSLVRLNCIEPLPRVSLRLTTRTSVSSRPSFADLIEKFARRYD